MNPIDFLITFFKTFDEGQAFLPSGTHAHKILTRGKPKQVWVSELSSEGVPVCGGNVNYYGVTLLDDGFVLYAEVASDSVNVEWQAVLETN
jgi:hypothetical protein